MDNARLLSLIPARAGSERLPGKNTRLLAGAPMISWAIRAAKSSTLVEDVVVSTDDERIGEIARAMGAEVPFVRPRNLAGSTASMMDVVLHALGELEALGRIYDLVMLLQPTSPLRTSTHIDEAMNLFCEKRANAVISVTETDHPVEWAKPISEDLRMDQFSGPEFSCRSQEIPVRYRVNGAIYIAHTEKLREKRSFFLKEQCFAYVMPREASIDVDSEFDFLLAELLLGK